MTHYEPPKQFPFKWGWLSFDLGKYRASRFAYSEYPYESLPPIDEKQLTGTLAWLGASEELGEREERKNESQARLGTLIAQAQQLGLTLPDAFLRLMASTTLQARIPSCTGCYFDLSQQIRTCPESEHGSIIRFLNDSQEVALWHLYLTPVGEERVLVASSRLDELDDPAYIEEVHDGLTDEKRQAIVASIMVCAPSFEAFVYRFWLENTIWASLHRGKPPLTETQRRYLAHYEPDHKPNNVSG